MSVRRLAVLGALLLSSGAGVAVAAETVTPRADTLLRGTIEFPRAQPMYVQTGERDGERLDVALGFHGRCKGGGLGQMFASNVNAEQRVRVRDGRFSATLTGVSRALGNGRTGHFKWQFEGRFTARDRAVATVSATAQVRAGGKTVSRCRTVKPARVELTRRGA